MAHFGVEVCFTDAPPISDDPQARLLVQVQGLFSEYEKAKLAELARRGKLYRVRSGEAIVGQVAYGYRRIPRSENSPAHLVIYEPEAAVVRRIFDERASGVSIRQIARHLPRRYPDTNRQEEDLGSAQLYSLLRNTIYAGIATWYLYENVPATGYLATTGRASTSRALTRARYRSTSEGPGRSL